MSRGGMILSPQPFERYVERARLGKTALWRIIAGALLVTLAFALSSLAVVALAAWLIARGRAGEGGFAGSDPTEVMVDFLGTPTGVACTLLSFLGMTIGVFLAVRLVHGRSFASVLGAEDRVSWSHFSRAFVAALIASALAEVAFYFVDPSLRRSGLTILEWLAWGAPLALLLFVQTSSEELAFRGYLMQSLAARFRSPLVWAVVPGLLFTVAHWNAESLPSMNSSMLVTIAAFAAVAALLVYATGDLGAAIGTHLGMNLFSILIVSHAGWLDGAALFVSRPMEGPDWTAEESLWLALINFASFAVMLLLLLGPRSPLRVIGREA